MRIRYNEQTLPPEPGSTSRCYEWIVKFKALGRGLTVLTTMPSYTLGGIYKGYRGRSITRDRVRGVDMLRVLSFSTPRKGALRYAFSPTWRDGPSPKGLIREVVDRLGLDWRLLATWEKTCGCRNASW